MHVAMSRVITGSYDARSKVWGHNWRFQPKPATSSWPSLFQKMLGVILSCRIPSAISDMTLGGDGNLLPMSNPANSSGRPAGSVTARVSSAQAMDAICNTGKHRCSCG